VLRTLIAARRSGRWRANASRSATGGTTVSRSTTTVPLTVGELTTLNYPSRNSCGTPSTVSAKVVYAGTHSVVLEDVTGPLAGQLDADFQRFGQLFDNTLYPIEQNFGNIEALDEELDNPGRVLMLFTPKVNAEGAGLLGFVTGCDFFDPAEAGFSASNKTKIFYARTALRLTPQNPNSFSFDDRPLWSLTMPSTLVHESKHIVAFAERITRNSESFEESWLEEATAQIASELYGRTVWTGPDAWRSNTTYFSPANTMYCEVRVVFEPTSFPECSSWTWNVSDNFFNLYDYYQDISNRSFLSPGREDASIYGSAWLFVRWLTDQYGGSDEGAFLRSLVQEGALTGVQNVEARSGRPFSELLANFMLSLIADDYPNFNPAAGARYTIPSWNTRDMFAGMSQDFNDIVRFPLDINPVNFGAFDVSIPVIAGASAAFFELSGVPPTRQLIDLGEVVNTAPIRLAIVRVQ
jgi:hypothetical protein